MSTVRFDRATRIYDGTDVAAVDALSLDIADGEFLVLVGPSGCGKSTSLRMLAGLEPIDSGSVFIDGKDVSDMRPRDRDVAMVFQSYALYPNMTARQNMAFALENVKMPKDEIAKRVQEASQILQLEELMDRKPAKMSGGQRQRVAMGRAIVRHPKVFCMDEPLSNLDAKLRVSTRSEIAALQRRLGVTTVYVTHDQTEAMTMGDRVCVLAGGRKQQVDTPANLYEHPVNTFVASFIGSPAITLIGDAEVRGSLVDVFGQDVALAQRQAGKLSILGVRPEGWRLASSQEPGAVSLAVDLVESLGAEVFAYCSPSDPNLAKLVRSGRITIRAGKKKAPRMGDIIHVLPILEDVLIFDSETGLALPRA